MAFMPSSTCGRATGPVTRSPKPSRPGLIDGRDTPRHGQRRICGQQFDQRYDLGHRPIATGGLLGREQQFRRTPGHDRRVISRTDCHDRLLAEQQRPAPHPIPQRRRRRDAARPLARHDLPEHVRRFGRQDQLPDRRHVRDGLRPRTATYAGPGGPPKSDAQVSATAFAVYVTNQTLAGTTAAAYGFQVSATGVGTRTLTSAPTAPRLALPIIHGLSVMDLLLAVNVRIAQRTPRTT